MRCTGVGLFIALVLLVVPTASHAACEKLVVVPLDPIGLSPKDARVEEDQVREILAGLNNVCVTPREQTAAALEQFEGHHLPPCDGDECRRQLSEKFDADWLYQGTVYGFGGGRTVSLILWNRAGTVVQRGSFASGPSVDPKSASDTVLTLLREARLGRSLTTPITANVPGPVAQSQRSHWPEIALGAGAVAALAAGAAFGAASSDTASRIASGRTGCTGTGAAYQSCFADTVHSGQSQATAANVLFGASALLGAGAAVFFVVDLP